MKVFKSEKGKEAIYESYDRLLEQWGIETEEMDIKGSYGTTHLITAGNRDNPPLLLFHGVGDNSALMWIYNAKALAENFRIYAVDAIGGAGKSVPGPEYKKGFNQVEWILELMDNLDIDKADAAGISYGCYLVQLLKVTVPERINRAVGISGIAAIEGTKSNILQMMKAFLPEALFPNDKNVVKLLKKLCGDDMSALTSNAEVINHWKLLLRNFSNSSMTHHKITKFTKQDFLKIKNDIKFLIGDKDILSYYPGSLDIINETELNCEIVPGAGHSVNHEKSELINKKILSFLND